jgi:hypothetical protein
MPALLHRTRAEVQQGRRRQALNLAGPSVMDTGFRRL